jgi:hypothetical protein
MGRLDNGPLNWWIFEAAPIEILSVDEWPRWLRVVFVVTFPVSGPLWLLCAAALLFSIFPAMLVHLGWFLVMICKADNKER